MRVLLATDLFAPSIGGTERHVEELARRLLGAGHDPVVATLTPGSATTPDGVPVDRLHGWSTRMVRRRDRARGTVHPPVADPGVVAALVRAGTERQVDLVHGHGWMAHSALPAATRLGVPTVVSLHDYGLRCARMGLVRPDGSACPGPSVRRCTTCTAEAYGPMRGPAVAAGLALSAGWADGAAAVVANSGAVAVDAVGHGVDPDRLHVVSPWMGPVAPGPLAHGPRTGFVAYAGRLSRAKGVDTLYEAFARRGSPPLVVMGHPDDALGPPPAGTEVHEDVSPPMVLATLAAASVVVVPSRYPEPFGLVALEAMALGTPVVGTRVGGLAAVLEGAAVVVEPDDPSALAAAVEVVMTHPDRAAELSRRGRARAAALDGFGELEALYRRLAQRQAEPRTLRR